MGRTIAAAAAGFVLWAVLWTVAGQTIMAITPGSFREEWSTDSFGVLLLFVVIGVLVSIVAGLVAAKIARGASMKAGWLLGIVLLLVALAVEIEGWEKTPVWYHVVLLAVLTPAVLIGAKAGSDARPGPQRPRPRTTWPAIRSKKP